MVPASASAMKAFSSRRLGCSIFADDLKMDMPFKLYMSPAKVCLTCQRCQWGVGFCEACRSLQETPVEATHWGRWARQLPLASAVPVLVAPPVVGGAMVGALRALTSFDAEADKKQKDTAPAVVAGLLPKQVGQNEAVLRDRTAAASPSGRDHATDQILEIDRAKLPARPLQPLFADVLSSLQTLGTQGKVRLREALAPALRALAAAVTLGSGASLGPEGPSVDIGRSAARALGSLLRSKDRRLLPLIAAGSGAGVAAGFNAPISGVFFAVESVLQRPSAVRNESGGALANDSSGSSSSALTVAMVLLASVVAAVVSQAGLGASPAFRVPEYELQSLFELPLVLVLGALCGLASAAFKASSEVSGKAFMELKAASKDTIDERAQHIMWPALGGLATGLVALAYPEVLYQGFGNVNAILEARQAEYAPVLLLQIVTAKILTTAICQRSGLVGGIYAPSIFMGAALGSAFGGIAAVVCTPLGLAVTAPQAYALVGVAGMLAAVCQVPLTAVLLLFELTHDYFIIIPTLASVGISYWVASFPLAAVLRPLSPVFRLLPSGSARSRSLLQEEVSAAIGDARADELPPLLNTPLPVAPDQAGASQEAAGKDTVHGSEVYEAPVRRGVARNGLLKGGHSGTYGRGLGRGLGAAVSFSGRAGRPATPGNAAGVNGAELEGALRGRAEVGLPPLVGSLAVAGKEEQVEDLTVLCALRQSCVMLTPDTSLTEALQVMDDAEESVALVLDDAGSVIGVVTRASVSEALSGAKSLDNLPLSL